MASHVFNVPLRRTWEYTLGLDVLACSLVASKRGSGVLGLFVFSPAEPWMEKDQQEEEEAGMAG